MTWKRRSPQAHRRRRRRIERDRAYIAQLLERKGERLALVLLRFGVALGEPFPHRRKRIRGSVNRRRRRRELYEDREAERFYRSIYPD